MRRNGHTFDQVACSAGVAFDAGVGLWVFPGTPSLGAAEANPKEGKISHESPLGKALIGRKVGEKVKVNAPAGQLTFKIKSIK